MDFGWDLAKVGSGITVALGSIKLLRVLTERRERAANQKPLEGETVREYQSRQVGRLFPNGEKDEFLKRMDELGQSNRDNTKDLISLESNQKALLKRFEDASCDVTRLQAGQREIQSEQRELARRFDELSERLLRAGI